MAIYHNTYSGIILKGLGGNACCGLITMGFSVFKCTISIVVPPIGKEGGGGGSYTTNTSGFYVPFPKQLNQSTRQVLITVKMQKREWRTSYIISRKKADIIVKVVNFVNKAKDKISVSITSLKRATRQITTVFHRSDK